MKHLVPILFLGVAACSTPGPGPSTFPEAQMLVEQVVSRHADIVRLTIHAVPRGEARSRVIASNIAEKLDDWSDPEDAQAMSTKKPVTLREGALLDYTAPVIDAWGDAIAAVGITLRGSNEDDMLSSAKRISGELTASILAARKALW